MRRLARSRRAATLPMMAAAVIPLIGIIGGGVDMTRIYLVKTRMQQACDGGALAARRSMSGSIMSSADTTTGQNFFKANLLNGSYGVQSLNFVLSDVRDAANVPTGAVHGNATGTLPLTLMRVFYKNGTIPLTVDCEANLNISNNDVLFVLDVTGSMSCLTSDSSSTCTSYAGSASNIKPLTGSKYYTTEKTNSRIDGLRTAVENFAATLSAATPTSARLRIGFLPYSSGINVGSLLYAKDTSWLQTTSTYKSRRANFTTVKYDANSPTVGAATYETFSSNITAPKCKSYGANTSFSSPTFNPNPSGTPVSGGGPAPTATTSTAYAAYSWGGSTNQSSWGTSTSTTKACIRSKTVTTTTYTTRYAFTSWSYGNYDYDTSAFIAGNNVQLVSGTPSSTARVNTSGSYTPQQLATMQNAGTASGMTLVTASPWDGCVIERSTGDDDVDTAPTSGSDTKWAPAWPEVVYNSSGSQPSGANYNFGYSCPKGGQRLNTITSANLATVGQYVNVLNGVQTTSPMDFVAHGLTYHDFGMMWGVRLMSTAGLFSSDFGAAPNGRPVNRHIIFMTDGDMQTSTTAYTASGIEPSTTDSAHNTRFLAACQAAKDHGISVWVVSFANGTIADGSPLDTCADEGQAFSASDSTELNTMFQRIAQRIAELRLVS
jgi:Flp pilus assembly protein TadG